MDGPGRYIPISVEPSAREHGSSRARHEHVIACRASVCCCSPGSLHSEQHEPVRARSARHGWQHSYPTDVPGGKEERAANAARFSRVMDGRALFGRQRLPVARLLLQAPDQVRHVGRPLLKVSLLLFELLDLAFPIFSPPTAEASLRVVAEARPSTVALAAVAPTAAALSAVLLFLAPVTGVAPVTVAVSTSNHVLFLSRSSRYRATNRAIPISVRSSAVAH